VRAIFNGTGDQRKILGELLEVFAVVDDQLDANETIFVFLLQLLQEELVPADVGVGEVKLNLISNIGKQITARGFLFKTKFHFPVFLS